MEILMLVIAPFPRPTIYSRIITDERAQRGEPMDAQRKNNRIQLVRSTNVAYDSSYYWGIPGGVNIFPVPVGLTWEHDILVLKPSPCLHNGNEVDDWMGHDEWNIGSYFKSETRTGAKILLI
ncbi:hypothetical protein TNCV_2341301 [Trichonephila clavipes]|nr:hypothetical protein TNCV_2341301 [Trichonephila clavipes]